MVDAVSQPVHPAKLMALILALLDPYYQRDVPQSVRELQADDWVAALSSFPEWAIVAACRWWKSAGNPDRRRRPLEGDIAEKASSEAGMIALGRYAVKRFDDGFRPYSQAKTTDIQTQAERAEAAKRIMAEIFNKGSNND